MFAAPEGWPMHDPAARWEVYAVDADAQATTILGDLDEPTARRLHVELTLIAVGRRRVRA